MVQIMLALVGHLKIKYLPKKAQAEALSVTSRPPENFATIVILFLECDIDYF